MTLNEQIRNSPSGLFAGTVWLDGTDGQEDELDDVSRGILDPPTDDEAPGSVDEPNKGNGSFEAEDEDDALIRQEEAFRRKEGNLPN